ncbi:MAG: cytochrome c oxidase subunit II [bacterium]|nr:cytochrome c oxidase subunit II [bacterium]
MFNVGTTTTEAVDNVLVFIIAVSVVLLVLITGLMIYFAIKYNHKRHPEPKATKEPLWLEVLWTVIPTILVLMMFWYGYEGFKLMRDVPEDAMTVKATGRMWDWTFEYENGKRDTELKVPLNKNVKVLIKSIDVLHSFYIPAYRVKEDAVPGLETYLWFRPDELGKVDIFCAEFCGQRHSYMRTHVNVMEEAAFNQWYNAVDKKEGAEIKEDPAIALMEEIGCMDCHTLGATTDEMLTLSNLMGAKRIVLAEGVEKEITIDETYIRRSITDPQAEIVKGQEDTVPMELPDELKPEELETIIRFLTAPKSGTQTEPAETTQSETNQDQN